MLAYQSGIFPWYSADQPILWWSPDPRTVLFPDEFHVSKSLVKTLRKNPFRITFDTAFESVVEACAHIARPDQEGTWITPEMTEAYTALHAQGHAHSVESWEGDHLVGGVYGVACGQLFSGESMFASSPDASKIAFVHLVEELKTRGFGMIDCQVKTDHLTRFGARSISRNTFLEFVHGMDLRKTKTKEQWGLKE
jgi:leucyl/phenylalanyl-tRNA--protein transferase